MAELQTLWRAGDHGIPEPTLRKGSPPLGHISCPREEGDFW